MASPLDLAKQGLVCWRQRSFDLGCRFQLSNANPARACAAPGFFGHVNGSTIFGRLAQFDVGTNTESHCAQLGIPPNL